MSRGGRSLSETKAESVEESEEVDMSCGAGSAGYSGRGGSRG